MVPRHLIVPFLKVIVPASSVASPFVAVRMLCLSSIVLSARSMVIALSDTIAAEVRVNGSVRTIVSPETAFSIAVFSPALFATGVTSSLVTT